MAPRKDTHRPSAIEPLDYEFVAFDYLKADGDILGMAMYLADQRKYKRAHMERTGGRYSGHEHGGNCHVCGSVNAVYTATFYHGKSNSYIKTGLDCADKLECAEVDAFRSKVKSAMEAGKGKRKAKAVLENIGFGKAWEIYEADAAKCKAYAEASKAWQEANPEPEYKSSNGGYGIEAVGAPKFIEPSKDEATVLDMVGRLIKWGDISDKAQKYLGVLLDRIARAPEIAAQRAAELEAAAPIPVFDGRVKVSGKVLTLKQPGEYDPYPSVKMLVQHKDGWKVWGTVPAAVLNEVERGDEIEFVARIQVSDRDPKFGFISRPGKAKVIKALAA